MLVSVHIPKTAGTSFSLSLSERFGQAYRGDYMDRLFTKEAPLDRKMNALNQAFQMRRSDYDGVECVHGHFLAFKYKLLGEQIPCTFVTWLRHPVARLMSQYYYWIESYDPRTTDGLHRRCMEEDWTLERFCLGEEMRDLQCQYLWSTPLCTFEFVGLTEHYAEDFDRFSRTYLGAVLPPVRVNATRTKLDMNFLDSGLKREIEAFHAWDMTLYEAAVARREHEVAASVHAAV